MGFLVRTLLVLSLVVRTDKIGALSTSEVCGSEFGKPTFDTHFLLQDGYINFNHGSFGSLPKYVLDAKNQLYLECEARPDDWFRGEDRPNGVRSYRTILKGLRKRLSTYIHARGDGDDVVFVENASGAVNAVLRSVQTRPGDIIIQFSVAYGMVKETVAYVEHIGGLKVVEIPVFFNGDGTMPVSTGGVDLVTILRDVMAGLESDRIKLLILDHIVSLPAVVLPVEALSAVAQAHGVPVFVDGAHALGAIPVNMTALEDSGVSFWVGNGHKWLYSPKGSAVLWVAPEYQDPFASSGAGTIVPNVINSPVGGDLWNNFEYTGTRDYTPFAAMEAALEFRAQMGGEACVMGYMHNLAVYAQEYLSELWGTETLLPPHATGTMSHPRLPGRNETAIGMLFERLYSDYNMYTVVFSQPKAGGHNSDGRYQAAESAHWMRLSAQIFLERDDFHKLGAAVLALCEELHC